MRRDAHEIGTATEAGDFSLDSVRGGARARAQRGARRSAFSRLPGMPRKLAPHSAGPADAAAGDLMRAGDAALVEAAWRIVGGALEAFATPAAAARVIEAAAPGLVLGGDVSMMRDRMALASSNFDDMRTDESAHFTSSVTALIESLDAKGTASALGATLGAMREASKRARTRRGHARARARRRRTAAGRNISRGVRPAAGRGNTQLHGDSVAHHRRVSRRQYGLSRTLRRAGDGLAPEPARRSRGGAGAIRRRMTCEGMPARRDDNDSGRKAGRIAVELSTTAIGLRPTSIAPRSSDRSAPSSRASRPIADIDWARARCGASTPIPARRRPTW